MGHWSRERFPIFVFNHGPWDIYANEDGLCAAIPTEEGLRNGNKASTFGTIGYARRVKEMEVARGE